MAHPARRRDAERKALGQPHVAQARCRTDQRVAVGGIADRAVVIVLQPHRFRGRDPVDHRHVFLFDPFQIQGKQVGAERFRHVIQEPRRGVSFIRPQDPAAAFLAHIPLRVGVAQDRVFGIALGPPLDQGRVGFGDDILMLDRNRGDADAQQAGGALRVVAGGGHDMLGPDLEDLARTDKVAALFHQPFAGHDPFAASPRIPVDLHLAFDAGAGHARALGHGLGHVGGVDIAVCRMEQRALQILGTDQRPAVPDLLGRQELMLDADRLSGGGIQHVFVHAFVGLGHAQVAAAGEARVQPGLRFQVRIKLDRIVVDMGGRIVHVEQRQQARRVPGRSGRQLVAFDQHRIPPRAGQVQGDAATNRAAPDDKNLHMRLHSARLPGCVVDSVTATDAARRSDRPDL